MSKHIDDEGYLCYLGSSLRQKQYLKWKNRILKILPDIEASVREVGLEKAKENFSLNSHEVDIMLRLGYLNEEEVMALEKARKNEDSPKKP